MEAVIAMIEGASVIILSVLCCAFLGDKFRDSLWTGGLVYGAVFAVTGVIVMSTPVEIIPGVRTDPRNAVMALSAGIGGPVSAFVTAGAMILMRLYYGGLGAFAGAWSITATACAAILVWWYWRHWLNREVSLRYIAALAVVAGLVPTVVIFLMSAAPPEVFLKSASLFAPTNFGAVLLLGGLIVREQQRRWAISAHAEMQARLSGVANNAPNVLFQMAIDESGWLTLPYVSRGAKRMFGVEAEDLMKESAPLDRLMGREAIIDLVDLVNKSRDRMRRWSFETRIADGSGEDIWVRMTAEPRIDAVGALVWDGSITDVTSQKRAERLKSEFVATVSHELRTPVTSISGSLELLVGGAAGELPATAKPLIDVANRNSLRLRRLIDDILDIEKIESGMMRIDPRPVKVSALVAASIEAHQNYRGDGCVTITCDDRAQGAHCYVDPDRMSQIMANLLSNAIKHSPAQGEVQVVLERRDGALRVSVKDHGKGIPVGFQSRIFGKFEQADATDSRAKGGTGLGLSICKALVDRMDGHIGFESEVGTGSVFFVEFKEIDGQSDTSRSEESSILLIERRAEVISAVRKSVEPHAGVNIAANIDDARRKLQASAYSLVLLGLPGSVRSLENELNTLPESTAVLDLSQTSPSKELNELLSTALKGVRPLPEEQSAARA